MQVITNDITAHFELSIPGDDLLLTGGLPQVPEVLNPQPGSHGFSLTLATTRLALWHSVPLTPHSAGPWRSPIGG